MRRGLSVSTSIVVAAVLAWPMSAVAATDDTAVSQSLGSADAIAALNAQRAANGLPAGITENAAWSDGCAKHGHYLELNNGIDFSNPHDEDPSRPGYTPEGQEAARSSVLGGVYDESGSNPWEDAPIHLMQLLGPGLAQTGYAPGCMWTWPGYTRQVPAETATYTYPGPGTSIYASQTASEWPYTPGERIGLPNAETGPYLYVFAFGAQASCVGLTSGSLSGPSGNVEVRLVDNGTDGVGNYLPPGGMLIPVNALEPASEYHALAQGVVSPSGNCTDNPFGDQVAVQWDWTFRTDAEQTPPETAPTPDPKLRLKAVRRWSRLRVDVDPNGVGNQQVTILRYAKNRWVEKRSVRTRGVGHIAKLNMPAGWYIARLAVAGGEVYSRRVRLLR